MKIETYFCESTEDGNIGRCRGLQDKAELTKKIKKKFYKIIEILGLFKNDLWDFEKFNLNENLSLFKSLNFFCIS